MWILIWLIITIFILSVSLWSFLILRQQKMAWKKFAVKHKFTYAAGKMMDSPYMTGRFDGYTMNFYTDTQGTEDMRGFRYVTVVELELGAGIPVKGVVGTEKTKEFVNSLTLTKDVIFEHDKWSADYIARTQNKKKFKAYFTKKRLDTLMGLLGMKGTTVMFFFDEIDAVLRIETSDPLRDAEKTERIMSRLVRDIKVLSPTSAEKELIPKRKNSDDDDEEDDDDDDDEGDYAPVVDADPSDDEDGKQDVEPEPVITAPLKPKKSTKAK